MKRWIYIAVGILACANLFAQDSLGVRKIGDIGDSWYNVVDMEIREPYLYVLNWDDALVVFRLVDNDEPKFVGRSMDLLGRSFKVFGSKAVIKVDSRRLRLADLSDPAAPRLTFVFNAEQGNGFADFCVFDENYLAITTWDYGLRIYDIINMSSPNLIATSQARAYGEVDASGTTLYVRASDSLYIFDASNPAQPQLRGARFWQGENHVQGDRLFRVNNSSGMLMSYSVVDPTNPSAIGDTLPIDHHWGHPGQLQKVSVSSRILAVLSAVSDDGYPDLFDLNLYRITESGAAESLLDTSWDGSYGEIAVGDSAIVIRHDDIDVGLGYAKILKNVEGAAFEQTFVACPWGAPMRLDLSGSKLLSNRAGAGWNVFDVSQPESPVWLTSGSRARPGIGYSTTEDAQIGADWLAVAGYVETESHDFSNFQIANTQDPSNVSAKEISGINANPNVRVFEVQDSIILLQSEGNDWLIRAVIANDSTVVLTDSVHCSFGRGSIQDIFVRDSRITVSCDYSLHLLELEPSGLTYLGGVELNDQCALAALDGMTLCRALNSSRWLQFYDVADPLNISFEGQIQLASTPNGLSLANGHVFYSNPSNGLSIERLVSFDSCLHVGHYNTNFRGEDIAVIDDIAYLANSQDIFVLDVSAAIGGGIPAAPQQVKISRMFDPDHLLLTWLPVTTDRVGAPITIDAYEIYRRNSSNEEWVNIGVPTPPTAAEYTIDIPTGANAFAEFQIRAVKY